MQSWGWSIFERGRQLQVRAVAVFARACFGSLTRTTPSIHVTYVVRDGSEVHVKGREGQNLLELAHEHGVDLEGSV